MNTAIFDKLKGIIKKDYIYVPPCPCCESVVTGRFVKSRNKKTDAWVLRESLKNGELVCLVPKIADTAFCLNCEYTWQGRISTIYLTSEQIAEERAKRQTVELLYELETTPEDKEKDAKRATVINKITSPFKKYIGTR